MNYPIAYVYKHQKELCATSQQRVRLDGVKGEIAFLSDLDGGNDFRYEICGMHYRGIIFSGDARLNKDSLEYLLGRMRHNDSRGSLWVIDDYHKELLSDIFENWYSYYEDYGDNEWMNKLKLQTEEMGIPAYFNAVGEY